MSIESVMPSNHLILCRPTLLLPSIFPSIGVFSNDLTLRMRWPKYWSFSFSVIPFCFQSCPALGFFFPMSQFFTSGGQIIGASASVLWMNIQGWFSLGLTGWISLQAKGLSRVFSNTTVQKHQFFATMGCSTPGFPVLHQVPKFAQIHVHWVDNAI